MNTSLQIRPATASDLDAVADVWRDSAAAMDGAPPDLPTRDELCARIDRELAAGWDLHLATRGQTPVAMLALKPAEGVLDQIFVLPDQQGSGLGTALLGLAQRLMPGGFTLRMAAANQAARSFYERRGLRLIGHERHPHTGAPSCIYGWEPRPWRRD
ncbi:N-acetyltransferase family protein [Phenylobacterium sp.]|uniref:GNAT family N-acetyltransferase n=1 Tax=Phenylobacterium sp. TaxID=1871053 RepID=UPI0035AF0782